MVLARVTAPIAAVLLLASPARAQETPLAKPFDVTTAWASFETLLGERYGYFDRPGIDGNAILSHFAEQARRAPDDKAFIDTLQLVAHNFADPHFVVGPLDLEDWAVIPTASDLFGTYDGTTFRIEEVRADSDALAKGIKPGMIVRALDGRSPRAAVEAITGRPFATLAPTQIDFAFNMALAGIRRRPRTLELVDGRRRRSRIALAATTDQAKRVQEGPLLSVERQGTLGILRIHNSLGD